MTSTDLDQVIARVLPARPAVPSSIHARHGRLDQLAEWWARVASALAPSVPAAAPHRVRQLWVAAPVRAAPASRAVVTLARPVVPDQVADAITVGVAIADDAADEGVQLLLVSVPGVTSWAALLTTHLLRLDPVRALGWPAAAGLDDVEWTAAVREIRDGLRGLHGLSVVEPAELLEALDQPLLAAATGLLLGAAARKTPVLLDGPGAAAAALLAFRACGPARDWWQPAHADGSALHDRALVELGLEPWQRLRIRAEDGTGPRLALSLLEAATAAG